MISSLEYIGSILEMSRKVCSKTPNKCRTKFRTEETQMYTQKTPLPLDGLHSQVGAKTCLVLNQNLARFCTD